MKLSRLLSFIAFVFSCVVVLPVFAEGTTIGEITAASKKTGDLSRQALATIYGDVVNNPLASSEAGGVDTILASIFQVLNGALLVVGSLWACYIIFRKLTRTAHDGAVFDKQNTTVWGPVRIVWGLVSLVPTANGWSLSQLLMLWSASTMGIGIANLSTDAAISAFEDGKGMVVQPAMPSTLQLAHNLFEANICMHGINAGLAEAAAQGGLVTQGGYVQQVPTSSGFTLKTKASYVVEPISMRISKPSHHRQTGFPPRLIPHKSVRRISTLWWQCKIRSPNQLSTSLMKLFRKRMVLEIFRMSKG